MTGLPSKDVSRLTQDILGTVLQKNEQLKKLLDLLAKMLSGKADCAEILGNTAFEGKTNPRNVYPEGCLLRQRI
jgi:hypothetical protein